MMTNTDSPTNTQQTIYALATPLGRSGVAVLRVSGPHASRGLQTLMTRGDAIQSVKTASNPCPSPNPNPNAEPKPHQNHSERPVPLPVSRPAPRPLPPPRKAALCKIYHPVSRETIDHALVIYFQSPASFTGEDAVEYHVHGGIAVVQDMLDALSNLQGHRMAEPGEFTRRAFENGKMDLTGAEAIADLIDAETVTQKNQALEQLGGALSRLYDGWRNRLTKALAYLEADIDFSDEDLPDGVRSEMIPVLDALRSEIADHLHDNRKGERLRNGIQVAVVGAPNAGKSSLVNVLAQRDVAIVSDQAGTTRDVIEVHLDIGGYPVTLADTAGLRPDQIGNDATGHDAIESEGIKRALERAEHADIRLLLFDGTDLANPDPHTLALIDDATALVVINKAETFEGKSKAMDASKLGALSAHDPVLISAKEETGIDALLEALLERLKTLIVSRETPALTRRRHREALTACYDALVRALDTEMPELMAEDVRLAMRDLGRITGRVDVEDLLDVIFRDFCIGK